jgi:hypothetical protein
MAAVLCLQLLGNAGCEEIYRFAFQSMGEPDPCDAGVNVYRGRTHFIERDFLREDGTIDYEKWVRITDPSLSPCDPLNTARERRVREAARLPIEPEDRPERR